MLKPRWSTRKNGNNWIWSNQEQQFIRKNVGRIHVQEVADTLGRSVRAVKRYVSELNTKQNLRLSIAYPRSRTRDYSDILGKQFGHVTVLRVGPRDSNGGARVWCHDNRDKKDFNYLVRIYYLRKGTFKGFRKRGIHSWSRQLSGISQTVEYRTVRSHLTFIRNPNRPEHRTYQGMPFYTQWNPMLGGSLAAGAKWICKHLGTRAAWAKQHKVLENTVSLHIVNHAKGFVPDNLMWVTKGTQSAEQMYKIIARLRHENKRLKSIIAKGIN